MSGSELTQELVRGGHTPGPFLREKGVILLAKLNLHVRFCFRDRRALPEISEDLTPTKSQTGPSRHHAHEFHFIRPI